jgi:hypothetical protein
MGDNPLGMDGTLTSMLNAAVLALSPVERWSALQRLRGGSTLERPGESTLLIAVVVLGILAVLLWWVSGWRKRHARHAVREDFSESAVRHGLSARERQILLAIVVRSGLGQSQDIFTTVDAFDRGGAKLLAECARTRTADENESLKVEITHLRQKLGFQLARTTGKLASGRRPSSRDIPVGKTVELTRRQRDGSSIQAEVIRNDDIELAVEWSKPVETKAGDLWLARYNFGMSSWEFDTVTIRSDGVRLVLQHSDQVRFVNRRRFPRVAVTLPAMVAAFPFLKSLSGAQPESVRMNADSDLIPSALEAPSFVRGVVTELAGPGLRIVVPVNLRVGDRVLVLLQLDETARSSQPAGKSLDSGCVVADMGYVRHVQSAKGKESSIAVELSGLSETDIDELVRFTNAARLRLGMNPDGNGDESDSANMSPQAVVAGGAK